MLLRYLIFTSAKSQIMISAILLMHRNKQKTCVMQIILETLEITTNPNVKKCSYN